MQPQLEHHRGRLTLAGHHSQVGPVPNSSRACRTEEAIRDSSPMETLPIPLCRRVHRIRQHLVNSLSRLARRPVTPAVLQAIHKRPIKTIRHQGSDRPQAPPRHMEDLFRHSKAIPVSRPSLAGDSLQHPTRPELLHRSQDSRTTHQARYRIHRKVISRRRRRRQRSTTIRHIRSQALNRCTECRNRASPVAPVVA